MKKITILIFFILLILIIGGGYIFNMQFKMTKEGLEKKEEEVFKARIAQERKAIQKDLEEKYRPDMVSFEAMAKKLEIEKNRTKKLEEQIKAQNTDKK